VNVKCKRKRKYQSFIAPKYDFWRYWGKKNSLRRLATLGCLPNVELVLRGFGISYICSWRVTIQYHFFPCDMDFGNALLLVLPYCIHAVAFVVKRPFQMRIGLVAGYSAALLYWIYVPYEIPVAHILGVSGLLFINLFQIAVLYKARHLDSWSEEERYLQSTAFRSLPNAVFKKLMDIAEWKTVSKGDTLVAEHQDLEHLMLVYDGTATIHLDGKPLTHLRDNNFIGEMSFLTGNPASATVKAATHMRIITWRKSELYDLMAKEPELKSGLQTLFSHDLVGKLSKQNVRQPKDA
jgi:hypothetical protein